MTETFSFVDTHVHFWDLTNNGSWYPMLMATDPSESHDVGLGDMSGMRRDYLPTTYRNDEQSAGVAVDKIVHVSGTTEPQAYLKELSWLDSLAAVHTVPTAFVGSIDPSTDADTVKADLETQATSPLFRGARVLFDLDPSPDQAVTRTLLDFLTAGDHVFDLVVHPGEVDGFGPLLAKYDTLRTVIEHCAWPDGPGDEPFAAWRQGLAKLASHENVNCKISGLAMSLHEMGADAFRPWLETIIETFGADRCVIGSNFPVDSLYGTYADLIATYRLILGSGSTEEQRKVWVENGERLYRI